jgi:hypothetical protein
MNDDIYIYIYRLASSTAVIYIHRIQTSVSF